MWHFLFPYYLTDKCGHSNGVPAPRYYHGCVVITRDKALHNSPSRVSVLAAAAWGTAAAHVLVFLSYANRGSACWVATRQGQDSLAMRLHGNTFSAPRPRTVGATHSLKWGRV